MDIKIVFYIFLAIISYIIIINFISYALQVNILNETFNQEEFTENLPYEKIDVGDFVSVSIKRIRWWGIIEEGEFSSNLYLFKIIPIPLKSSGVNLLNIHLFFIIGGITIIILIKYRSKRNEKHMEVYTDLPSFDSRILD